MDNIFLDLDIYESLIDEYVGRKAFAEYCHVMNQLDEYGTPDMFVLEAVMDPQNAVKSGARMTISNTISTTGDVVNAYDKTTTANANVIKATWNLFMKGVNLVVNGVTKVLNLSSKLPIAISNTVDAIAKIPQALRVKIRGDITLFIGIPDIEALYNRSLLLYITQIIDKADLLSQGETWTRLFQKKKMNVKNGTMQESDGGKKKNKKGDTVKVSDQKLLTDIRHGMNMVESIKFEPTVIKMNNPDIVDAYFNPNNKSVKFRSLDGTAHECSYYQALNQVITDMKESFNKLKDVQIAVGVKFEDSRENNSFSTLDAHTRSMILAGIQDIAKIVSIFGNLIGKAMQDMNTIEKAIADIRKKTK